MRLLAHSKPCPVSRQINQYNQPTKNTTKPVNISSIHSNWKNQFIKHEVVALPKSRCIHNFKPAAAYNFNIKQLASKPMQLQLEALHIYTKPEKIQNPQLNQTRPAYKKTRR
ncbi:hypothetical protein RYX36_013911 [Vicia faba]